MINTFMQFFFVSSQCLIDFHFTEYIIKSCYRTYLLTSMMFKWRHCPSFGVIDLPTVLIDSHLFKCYSNAAVTANNNSCERCYFHSLIISRYTAQLKMVLHKIFYHFKQLLTIFFMFSVKKKNKRPAFFKSN